MLAYILLLMWEAVTRKSSVMPFSQALLSFHSQEVGSIIGKVDLFYNLSTFIHYLSGFPLLIKLIKSTVLFSTWIQKGETVKKMREEVSIHLGVKTCVMCSITTNWGCNNCGFVFPEWCSYQYIRGIISRENSYYHGTHRRHLQSFLHDRTEVWGGTGKQTCCNFPHVINKNSVLLQFI